MRVQDFLDRLVRAKLWHWLLGRSSPQVSARSDRAVGEAPRHGPTRTPRTPPKVDPKYACEPFRGAAIDEDHEGAGLDHQYARSARESGSHGAGDDAQIVSPSDPRTARGGSGGGDEGWESRRRRSGRGRKGSRGTKARAPSDGLGRPPRRVPQGDKDLWEAFIASVNPYKLERIVLAAYREQGYSTVETPLSGDEGLDGLLYRDDSIAIGIQVKRYKHSVGSEMMRNFIGSLKVKGLEKGIFLMTGRVSHGARQCAAKALVTIVEGDAFRKLLLDHVRGEVVRVVQDAAADVL
jgi:hypothetical protein